MSNLMNSVNGRQALTVAARWLLERRMSRFFKRNNAIEVNTYRNGGSYTLENLLGALNETHDDEILDIYNLLGIVGGLTETVQDLNYYVDPATGSDSTGDGTQANPYASIWFLENLPRHIKHGVRINIMSDYQDDLQEIVIDNTFSESGFLTFLGVGAPTVNSGPYTVAGNVAMTANVSTAIQATVPIGGSFENRFLRVLTATNPSAVGHAGPIIKTVAADTLCVQRLPFSLVQAGDTFDIVTPSIGFRVKSITHSPIANLEYKYNADRQCRVSFANLDIHTDPTGASGFACVQVLGPVPLLMSFSTLNNYGREMQIENGKLNLGRSYDSLLELLSQSGVTNISKENAGPEDAAGLSFLQSVTPNLNDVWIYGNSQMWNVHTLSTIRTQFSHPYISRCSFSRLWATQTGGTVENCIALGHTTAATDAAIKLDRSQVDLTSVICLDTSCFISASYFATSALFSCGKDATYGAINQYGVYVNGPSTITLSSDPTTLLVGTSGDILYETVNPSTTPAFPAAYGVAADGQGSFIKRLSL